MMPEDQRERELAEVRTMLQRLTQHMEESIVRQRLHDPFITRMMQREQEQDELYRSIKNKVIGAGVLSAFSMAGLILWYGIKAWLGFNSGS